MSAEKLFAAIRAGDRSAVISLLDANPSLCSAKNDAGVSAVLMSVYTGRGDLRDLFLSRGASLELHDAAAVGNLERAKQIVDEGPAGAGSFSPDGFPVVALAAVFGHLQVAKYLAERGADVNAPATNGSGYNALTGAVAGGHTAIVAWLLKNGANANYRYGPGYSPLLTAAANGHLEIVKLLLAHGADPHAISNDGQSALALATERNHAAISEFLRSIPT
jgi:ankyrin repeat protein